MENLRPFKPDLPMSFDTPVLYIKKWDYSSQNTLQTGYKPIREQKYNHIFYT